MCSLPAKAELIGSGAHFIATVGVMGAVDDGEVSQRLHGPDQCGRAVMAPAAPISPAVALR